MEYSNHNTSIYRSFRRFLCSAALFAVSGIINAAPIVAVDVDPLSPGIQTIAVLASGSSLTFDIVVTGVDASASLSAFEFDLNLDFSVLNPTNVTDGGFLSGSVFPVEADLITPDVNFSETSLGGTGASGSGILARVTVDALSIGPSILDLNNVILSAAFGTPITVASVNDANITVVPLPSALLLFISGCIGFGGYSRFWRYGG